MKTCILIVLSVLSLAPVAWANEPPYTTDTSLGYASSAEWTQATDLDGDGDVDVVVADRDKLRWYENKKNKGTFKERAVEEGLRDFSDAAVVDVDGDGDMDLVASAHMQQTFDKTGGLFWWENVSKARAWKRHAINATANGVRGIAVGDFDGDKDIDVACGGVGFVAYYANGGKGATWSKAKTISTSKLGAWDLAAGDIDGDGDVDLAVGSQSHSFDWLENTPKEWKPHSIKKSAKFAREVHLVDLDGDKDLDLIGVARTSDLVIVCDNADGKGTFAVETLTLKTPGGIAWGDVDGDKDLDLIVVPADYPSEIAWFEQDDGDYTKHTIASTKKSRDGFNCVSAGDLNGDGKVDVVLGSYAKGNVRWLKHDGKMK